MSVSTITERTAELSWEYSGTDAVRYEYLVTSDGNAPAADAVPLGTIVFGPPQYSDLWGENGELWDPSGPLPDMTDVGYMQGEEPIPDWPIGENVMDHGAVGDGIADDTQAIRDAIAACDPEHAVYLPNGTYLITGLIELNKNYIVIRGESRDGTILKFNEGLRDAVGDPAVNYTNWGSFVNLSGNINIYSLSGDSTHRSIENLTFEFPAIPSEGHFSDYGASAITLSSVRDSWVRNILIKNADHGILMSGAVWCTVMNIEFDNFPGRVATGVGGDSGYVGHNGVKVTGRYNLVHDINFPGPDEFEHSIGFNNLTQNNVISRIRGTDLQLDDHGGELDTSQNYFTEINLGEGTPEDGRPTYRGNNEQSVFWNIGATTDQTYSDLVNFDSAPDPTKTSVVVGLRTSDVSDIENTGYWHETKVPELLHPQNIYLAQMATKLGKEFIDEQFGHGGMTGTQDPVLLRGFTPNTDYQVYLRSRPVGGAAGDWAAATSFSTLSSPPAVPAALNATTEIGSVTLSWHDNDESDLAGYAVYRSEVSGDFSAALVWEVGVSEYIDASVQPETTYYYAVKAFNLSGAESALSEQVPVETLSTGAQEVPAVANAAFVGELDADEAEELTIRNASGLTNDRYAYLRFPVNATMDTVAGVPLDDIESVALKFTVTFAGVSDLAIMGLDDLADADDNNLDDNLLADSYLSETTWSAENLTGLNRPDGAREAPNDLTSLPLATVANGGLGFTELPEVVRVPLDLEGLRTLVAASSNDEITLIVTGPRNGILRMASLTNTSSYLVPTLEITPRPPPADPVVDADLDGMKDTWEVTYFGSSAAVDGRSDSDGDGVLDFFEYLYGSIPNDASDGGFAFTAQPNAAGSQWVVEWTVQEGFVLGVDYTVQLSTDLSKWDPLPVEHYSLNQSTSNGKTRVELQLTHDYRPQVFLKLMRP